MGIAHPMTAQAITSSGNALSRISGTERTPLIALLSSPSITKDPHPLARMGIKG